MIAGRDAATLARRHGTPLYVYDLTRIGEQIEALQTALDRAKLASRVRVALKASMSRRLWPTSIAGFLRAQDEGWGSTSCCGTLFTSTWTA